MKWTEKVVLPDRESNPGLPRDRRRSSPLDYRGLMYNQCKLDKLKKFHKGKKVVKSLGFVQLRKKSFSFSNISSPLFKWRWWWGGGGRMYHSQKIFLLRAGFEPATYGCLLRPTTVHRSTNWAIEGNNIQRQYLSFCVISSDDLSSILSKSYKNTN